VQTQTTVQNTGRKHPYSESAFIETKKNLFTHFGSKIIFLYSKSNDS